VHLPSMHHERRTRADGGVDDAADEDDVVAAVVLRVREAFDRRCGPTHDRCTDRPGPLDRYQPGR